MLFYISLKGLERSQSSEWIVTVLSGEGKVKFSFAPPSLLIVQYKDYSSLPNFKSSVLCSLPELVAIAETQR